MDKLAKYLLRLSVVAIMHVCAGCQTNPQQMPPPKSLESVPALKVQRAGPLWLSGIMTAGPWKMTNVSVGFGGHWCSHHLLSIDSIDKNSYSLTVTLQTRILRGACRMKRSGRFYRLSDEPEPGTESSTFDCNFSGSDAGALHLGTNSDGTKHGELTFDALKWDVHSVHIGTHPQVSFMPLGYEIWNGDVVIAAVELFRDDGDWMQPDSGGRIWIDPSLSMEDQQRVVIAAGALLLYAPPDGAPLQNCQ